MRTPTGLFSANLYAAPQLCVMLYNEAAKSLLGGNGFGKPKGTMEHGCSESTSRSSPQLSLSRGEQDHGLEIPDVPTWLLLVK